MENEVLEHGPITLPTSRTALFDPPTELALLRSERPLCRLRYEDGNVGWLVTSHALARTVLTDPRFSMAARPLKPLPVGDYARARSAAVQEALAEDGVDPFPFLFMDPPEHTRLRRLVAGHFTVRRIREHRPAVERTVIECLDTLEANGPPADLVQAFALPVAMEPQCALLGMPSSYGQLFLHSRTLNEDPETSVDALVRVARDIRAGITEVIERKRRDPGNDVVSDLVANPSVNDDDTRSLVHFLFGSGVDVTQEMVSLGVLALLTHTDQLAGFRSGVCSVEAAVEELLRYLTNIQVGAFTRTAVKDVELGGQTIAAGEMVTVSLAAANRDPSKFNDPDRLELARDEAGHLAFGQGVHMCIGQHLARLELQVAIRALFERFPTLRLAVHPDKVPRHSGDLFVYGVDELLVEWECNK